MKSNVRAAMAATAISHAQKKPVSSIYDYAAGSYIHIDVSCSETRVDGHDYTSGAFDGNFPDLYHYGIGGHIDLKPLAEKYEGYDYSSSSHFEVQVKGNNAEVYDYGSGQWFTYSV